MQGKLRDQVWACLSGKSVRAKRGLAHQPEGFLRHGRALKQGLAQFAGEDFGLPGVGRRRFVARIQLSLGCAHEIGFRWFESGSVLGHYLESCPHNW